MRPNLIFILVIFSLTFSNIGNSQISFGKNGTFANKWFPGTLVLNSGDTIVGLLKNQSNAKAILGMNKTTNYVQFRKTEKGKKKKYKKETIDFIQFKNNYDRIVKFKTIKTKTNRVELLKVIVEGEISLFEKVMVSTNASYTSTYSNLYAKRTEDEIASDEFFSNILKDFNNTAVDYFSDCPELVDKINNNEFHEKNRIDDLINIVLYYNNKCHSSS